MMKRKVICKALSGWGPIEGYWGGSDWLPRFFCSQTLYLCHPYSHNQPEHLQLSQPSDQEWDVTIRTALGYFINLFVPTFVTKLPTVEKFLIWKYTNRFLSNPTKYKWFSLQLQCRLLDHQLSVRNRWWTKRLANSSIQLCCFVLSARATVHYAAIVSVREWKNYKK